MDINTILKLPQNERYTLLKDSVFRSHFFESENHYQIVWLLQWIKKWDIVVSKLLGEIPLVIINTKKYIHKKDGFVSADEDKYISSFEAYSNISYRKR